MPKNPILTARQTAVLSLIAAGHSNRVIAERLGISENGVKNHVSRLLDKFDVPTRAALVAAAPRDQDGPDSLSGTEVVRMLSDSLSEVLGTTATRTLMRRACKRAGIGDWDPNSPPANTSMQTVAALVAALWPLLIETTGSVLVGRLQSRGLGPAGAVDVTEVAAWLR